MRKPIQFLFTLLALCSLAACAAPTDGAQTTVRFMVWGDPPEQEAFRQVIVGFEETAPDVKIELIALPSSGDLMTRLTTDFAAGVPPDVFLLNYRRMAQFANKDALALLDERFKASDSLNETDFYPIALDAFRDTQGRLICLPQNISSQVVYYNKDLFDAAGQAYPNPDWDWAEFRATALAMTQPDNNGDGEPDIHGLGLEPRLIRMASFIWQNGGTVVDDPTSPTRLTLDSPAAMEAMTFVSNLSVIDGVVPNRTAEAVQSHGDRFLSGNVAMYVNSRRIVPTVRAVVDFNWDVAPLPQGQTAASVLHSDAYCLAAASDVADAAWRFIEFAIGERGQQIAAELGRTVPSMRRVAESEYFLDPTLPPANAQVWLDITPHLRLLPRLENWPEIERVGAVELELTYLNTQPLVLAVANIQATSERNFVPLK